MSRFPPGTTTHGHAAALLAFEAAAVDASLVTFDLFDTLLLRTVRRPTDLFGVMAASLRPVAANVADGFAAARVAAEVKARKVAAQQGRHDVTLAGIYDHLSPDLIAAARAAGLTTEDLLGREIALEVDCAVPDDEVVASFRRITATGTRVAIVSDMYLPMAALEGLLARIGVGGYHAIHLSCEAGGSKAEGTIWAKIREEHKLAPEALIVHLGDHPDADGSVARAHGIHAVTLAAPHERLCETRLGGGDHWFLGACEALATRALRRHAGNSAIDPYWLKLAYLVVLPVALGMCGYINDLSQELEVDSLFFLARDGLIFRRVFESAFRRPDTPETGYVWASRRCLNMANISTLDASALAFLTSGAARLSPVDYLRRIAIDPEQPLVAQALAERFTDPARVVRADEMEAVRDLMRAIEPLVLDRAAQEREPLLAHLEELGLFRGRSLVVDLGWHGSLQRSLMRLGHMVTGQHVDTHGAYLGTMGDTPTELDGHPLHLHGWLFEQGEPEAVMAVTLWESVEVIELLFSAPRFGVRYLTWAEGEIRVVRSADPAELHRIAIARIFHDEVEEAARLLAPLVPLVTPGEWRALAIRQFRTLLQHPDAEDIAHFRAIRHAEGFGDAKYAPIIPPAPRANRAKALVKAYDAAFWRRAFRDGLSAPQRAALSAALKLRSVTDRLEAAARGRA